MSAPSDEAPRAIEDAPQSEPDLPPARPPWMRRLAPLMLVGGLLAGGSILLPRLPKERDIELRIDDAATVVGVDLAWADASGRSSGEGTSLHGSSWHFAPGTAPRSLRTKVSLPDGSYALEITVDRTLGRGSERRSIDIGDAERIMLPVR